MFTVSGTNNTFSGGVLIEQGTLVVAGSAALGPASNTVLLADGNTSGRNDGTAALLIAGSYSVPNPLHVQNNNNNGVYIGGSTANNSTFSGTLALDRAASLLAASGGTATFSGVLSGAGGVTAGAAGFPGSVVLSASDTYSGGTTVAYGTLALSGSGALVAPPERRRWSRSTAGPAWPRWPAGTPIRSPLRLRSTARWPPPSTARWPSRTP